MGKKFTNNKKEFAILVDSCCDVPEEYLKDYPIYVIPLRINYKNASFKDRVEYLRKLFIKIWKKRYQQHLSLLLRM